MKICQVMAGKGSGGLEKHVIELTNELTNKNHEVIFVGDKRYHAFLGARVVCVDIDLSGAWFNPIRLWKMYKLFRKYDFDVIHAQANKAIAVVGALRSLFGTNVLFVGSLHNYKRSFINFNKFDVIIAVSHRILKPLNHHNVEVVYNGIDFGTTRVCVSEERKTILKDQLGINTTKPVICSIGRLVEAKRFDILLNSIVGFDLNLLIIGDGILKEKLENLAMSLGIKDQIKFLGYRNDIQELLSIVDLVVVSSDREGLPYAFIEVLASRTPIISTDVSDLKLILGNDYIVQTGDSKALHDKIDEFLKSDKLRQGFEKIFDHSEEIFSLPNKVDEIVNIYKKNFSTKV